MLVDVPASYRSTSVRLSSLPASFRTRQLLTVTLVTASKHQLQEEALFRKGPEAEGLQDAVAQLAGIAQAELRTARECFDGTTGLPKRAVPVFLAAVSPPIPLRAPFSLFVCVLTLPRGRWKRPPSDPGEVVPGPARLAQSRLQPVRRDPREAVLEAAVPGVGRCQE